MKTCVSEMFCFMSATPNVGVGPLIIDTAGCGVQLGSLGRAWSAFRTQAEGMAAAELLTVGGKGKGDAFSLIPRGGSPDAHRLLAIAGGTILGVPHRTTWRLTRVLLAWETEEGSYF